MIFLFLFTLLCVIPYLFSPAYSYDELALIEKGHLGFVINFYKNLLTRKVFWVGLLISFFMLFTITKTIAQTATADPAYWNMQRAMGGIIQQAAQARGYSTTDPRTYSTLYGIGKAAVGATAVGAVGTGILVTTGVVTAPAWGTVLAVAAVSGAVSYAVALGVDAIVRWAFGTNSVTSAKTWSATYACSGTYAQCATPVPPKSCSAISNTAYPAGTINQWIVTCSCALDLNSVCVGSESTVTAAPSTMTVTAAALTPAQLTQPVSYDAMAKMINYLWLKASQRADYAGLPYSTTQPITIAEVQTWATANPTIYPTVASLTVPITDSSGFVPSVTTSAATAVVPATSLTTPVVTTTTTTTNSAGVTTSTATSNGASQPVTVTNKVSVDFGVDPTIASPSMESTPSADSILFPLLNLFPTFKNFAVPAHSGVCPKPTFDVFNKNFLMDSHCTLFENQRTVLFSAMMLVYVLVSIFIVFKA
jgi:hypothetical protein